MALFKHGSTWWFEYRKRKPYVRVVKSTGFSTSDADGRRKAQAAFDAFKMGIGLRPKRSAMEAILDAIYATGEKKDGLPIASMWTIYEDWCRGKGRVVANRTFSNQKHLFARFATWAEGRGCSDISDVTVQVAREFVAGLGKSNKTVRTYCGYISQVWDAVGQMREDVHNPWKAATPDNDGSSVRKEMFTEEEVGRILNEAKRVGHDWHLACMVALYTGLRYGNIATMQIEDIDFDRWIFGGIHNKTKRSSGVEIFIPVAEPLRKLLLPYRGGTGFLLPEHGIRYGGHGPGVPFSDILKAVGLEGKEYGFHSFRHTANSRMAEAGVPSEIRQILCGWTNDAMARHYDHAKHLKELTEAIGKI